ncbi:MAG TPA: hypothetical protein VNB22_21170 [Pyrinomonadaceae bacterium]|nr:hypothetical protein [Pyrinomonadaceae bacterium]
MWNKIYLAGLAVALVVMSFFVVYSHSWFGSIGNPKDALAGFDYYAGLGSTFLWCSTAILLILANIILWNSRRAWAMWASFVYFAIFIILRYFWLEKESYNFQNSNSFFLTPIFGVVLIVAFGAIVFVNQFLNLRLNEKMYPPRETEAELREVEEETSNEKDV